MSAMVLTTESLVADKPEPPAPAAPAGGDMGGMYEALREPQAPRPSAVGLFFFSVQCFFFSR